GLALAGAKLVVAAPYLAPSTKRMAERLEKIAQEADPLQNPFLNHRAAEIFRKQLEEILQRTGDNAATPGQIAAARYKYAYELLHAGESEAAVREFEALRSFIAEGKVNLTPDKLALVRLNTMVSYLRLGEQDNCLLNHTTAPCILP